MNPEYDKRLEAAIGRELKALRELPAPATLIPRVLAAVERPTAVCWWRRPWQQWPVAARAVSFALLLAMFGGLCFAGWQVSRTGGLMIAARGFAGWFTDLRVAWDTLRVLAESGVLVARQLGTGCIVAFLVLAGCSYFACIGLGTVFVRCAFVRR